MTSGRFADLAAAFRECLAQAESELTDLERENFLLTVQRDEARLQIESLQRLLIEQSTSGVRSENPADFGPAHCKRCGDSFTKHGPSERVCPPCRTSINTQGAERARVGRAAARVAEKPMVELTNSHGDSVLVDEDVAFS